MRVYALMNIVGRKSSRGFTVFELPVVILMIAALAAVLLPAWSRAKGRALAIQCQSNVQQLQAGWAMYCTDNRDKTPQVDDTASPQPATWAKSWVGGNMSGATTSTNTLAITTGQLWKYTGNLKFYRCPADTSRQFYPLNQGPLRVRSVSCNQAFARGDWLPFVTYRTYTSQSQIVKPDSTFVFVDEAPASINDSSFAVQMTPSTASSATVVDYPAGYHSGGCDMSFADGHSVIHKWKSSLTWNMPVNGAVLTSANSSFVEDMKWLSSVTTVAR